MGDEGASLSVPAPQMYLAKGARVSPGTAGTLNSADIAKHAAMGIPLDTLERAQVRRLNDADARAVLAINGKAGDYSGVEYPYIDPATKHRVTSRVRLDHPPAKSDGTPDGKYRAPFGDNRHLYFPPGSGPLLTDPSVVVAVVEAEKSALAITAAAARAGRRVLVVACGGCWNWRGRIGKAEDATGARVDVKGALPDLGLISWAGRPALILFDARPNDSVNAARRALASELSRRGADVRHAHLPDDPLVNGPDDLIATRGDGALWRVLDEAKQEEFRRTKKGVALGEDLDNIRLALQRLQIGLSYDAFIQQTRVDGAALEDATVDRLWVQIIDAFGLRPSKETLRTVLMVEAQRATIHPVRDYLDSLVWDGSPRLDDWLITYGGAEPSDYVRAVGALPLIAAVRRVRQPGAKFDELLVLESEQGTLKSSALRTLCPDEAWFSDSLPLGVDSKIVIERTAGKWIIEAGELHGNRGREVEQLKAFLSRQVDGPVRLAFGRLPTTVPRQFVMIGTTNLRAAYLKDSTGGRRFWPVRVRRFDTTALQGDRDQLWAEAKEREAPGESIRLAPNLWAAAGDQQEQRRAADPWEDALESLLETDEDAIAVDAIWKELGVEARCQDNGQAGRVAAIMQRHGFTEKKKFRRNGKPAWHWLRVPGGSEPCS
jgi:hypothetical protein